MNSDGNYLRFARGPSLSVTASTKRSWRAIEKHEEGRGGNHPSTGRSTRRIFAVFF